MRENFNRSLDETLRHEGGYVNHPADPGGHTNKGVTLKTLRSFMPGATVNDLKKISTDMLRRIYRTGYWNPVSGDTLAAGVDLATFDYAVNSGPGAAQKSLFAVVGGSDVQTVKKLCARRLAIYRTFKHWGTFGKGWTRRIAAIEAKGVAWALAALPGMERHDVREKLADESAAAEKQAGRDGAGAGGAGAGTGGGAVAVDQATDATAAWIIIAVIVAVGGATVIVMARRAWLNRIRAQAYRDEANGNPIGYVVNKGDAS